MKNTSTMMKKKLTMPTTTNISYMWNFGSLLIMSLMIQVMSGILLSTHYSPNVETAFHSISHIMYDTFNGWMIRYFHMNGASLMFILMYIHVARSLYYGTYNSKLAWTSGMVILLLMFTTAFMGYVLPWGQMSFWGATVITSLLSTIPTIGQILVEWAWGGFSVNNATLTRFFTIHFIMPLIILVIVMIHLITLHLKGSSSPLGLKPSDKIPFHPYFTIKDMMGFIPPLMVMVMFISYTPNKLNDPDNFIPANPMITPTHIKPEWYFLFAYAILRAIPNKLGGVIALMMSILILTLPPMMENSKLLSMKFYPLMKMMFWIFISNFFMLTWMGNEPVEDPYVTMSRWFTSLYFFYFITLTFFKSLNMSTLSSGK